MKHFNTRDLLIISSDVLLDPSTRTRRPYQPPLLLEHGSVGSLIHGASWKGVDSTGEIDPENAYPA